MHLLYKLCMPQLRTVSIIKFKWLTYRVKQIVSKIYKKQIYCNKYRAAENSSLQTFNHSLYVTGFWRKKTSKSHIRSFEISGFKGFMSASTITAISLLPLLISQLFSPWPFWGAILVSYSLFFGLDLCICSLSVITPTVASAKISTWLMGKIIVLVIICNKVYIENFT